MGEMESGNESRVGIMNPLQARNALSLDLRAEVLMDNGRPSYRIPFRLILGDQ
jgi:hypothetical protein